MMTGRVYRRLRERERERKKKGEREFKRTSKRCGVYTSSYSFNLLKSESKTIAERRGNFCCTQKRNVGCGIDLNLDVALKGLKEAGCSIDTRANMYNISF